MGVGRNHHPAIEKLLDGGRQGGVARGRALEHDELAVHGALADHAMQIVLDDGIDDGPRGFPAGHPLAQEGMDVLLHENRAAAVDVRGGDAQDVRAQLRNPVSELRAKLFDKRSGSGCADIVHVGVDDPAVLDTHVLSILTADLENRLNVRGDPHGAGDMG